MPTDKSHTLDSSPIIALKDAGHLARLFAYGLALSALAVAQEFKAGAVEPADISIQVDKPGIPVSPTLYGIFFEEINRAGDGGIYAEMIQNRSFEDDSTPIAWSLVKGGSAEGSIDLDKRHPLNANNPTCLRMEIKSAGGDRVGAASDGFKGAPQRPKDKPDQWRPNFLKSAKESDSGIAVEAGKQYNFSLYGQAMDGFSGPLMVSLEKQDGTVLASKQLQKIGAKWNKFEGQLIANANASNARLVVAATQPGTILLDMVSLFPKETFKGRSNGIRADLAQMLVKMHPAFVRFPGGCFVEGEVMADAARWKQSIGDIAQRPGHYNLWGYTSTNGLGYHEYLQFCEDIGAEPLFVINVGMAHKDHVPMEKMDEFVQDALDAIEYANGSADSTWGALRAKAGHPKPFNLKFMEIGNENGGPAYYERYALMHDAIKKRYPQIQLIACDPKSARKNAPLDITDEHYYASPKFFANQAARYDSYDRKGPKIYIGEFAVTRGPGAGKLSAALGEAAFMTGMERNADVVAMGSYAPLLELAGWKTWNPNAIVFNSSKVIGIPSYHAQAMFANNRADIVLPVAVKASSMQVADFTGNFGVGTWNDTKAEFKDIKVTQGEEVLFSSDFSKSLAGFRVQRGDAKIENDTLMVAGTNSNSKVLFGGDNWGDCTLSLNARKISGPEGFLVYFETPDYNDKAWWNLGGWGNTVHCLENEDLSDSKVPGRIETDRWYDIRIERKGSTLKCFLDGTLVHESSRRPAPSLFAIAGRKNATGEIIVKVVNMSPQPQPTRIGLNGAGNLLPEAKALVMASEDPLAGNSIEKPENVIPKEIVISGIAPSFEHTFPANSITILRIKESKAGKESANN